MLNGPLQDSDIILKYKVVHHVGLQRHKTKSTHFRDSFFLIINNHSFSKVPHHLTGLIISDNNALLTIMTLCCPSRKGKKKSSLGKQPFVMSPTALITRCYFFQPGGGFDC